MAVDMVLIATPTRLAATSITWQPQLPEALALAMRMQNTWMGGMGKVAFVYDTPWCAPLWGLGYRRGRHRDGRAPYSNEKSCES
jgi:hypothetical protein